MANRYCVPGIGAEGHTRMLFGRAPTTGERIGSVLAGGLFAPGLANVAIGSSVTKGAVNGASSGALGNLIGQGYDNWGTGKNIDRWSVFSSAAVGFGAGAMGGKMDPLFGRTPSIGNGQSAWQGALYGTRVQAHNAPGTAMSIVTQGHLDPVAAILIPDSKK